MTSLACPLFLALVTGQSSFSQQAQQAPRPSAAPPKAPSKARMSPSSLQFEDAPVIERPLAANVVVPQARALALGQAAVRVTAVSADVVISDQIATTTLTIDLSNPSPARTDAELLLPVADGALVRGAAFPGAGVDGRFEILARPDARRTYDAVVSQLRDPAPLEFLGAAMLRSSVFPMEARGSLRVRVTFENALAVTGNRVDYLLPRSESPEGAPPWTVNVRLTSRRRFAAIYSPTHRIETRRTGPGEKAIAIYGAQVRLLEPTPEPGPFRLSILYPEDGQPAASFFSFPDGAGGGYFLLLAGAPSRPEGAPEMKREVTLALDRSGSMSGEKITQVRAAAKAIIKDLKAGEAFNVISYNQDVEAFADAPVPISEKSVKEGLAFVDAIEARGGTNLHDALAVALRQKPLPGALPIVLFMTDGIPTVGPTREGLIQALAQKGNPHQRRVFTFGVGADVNAPLLERIAWDTRATATFVLPSESVETRMEAVFARLRGPVLIGPELRVEAAGRVRDVVPARVPDFFEGEEVVVLGRYLGSAPIPLTLSGTDASGKRFAQKLIFEPASAAGGGNAFVPRLWATRQLGVLLDAVRALGADHDPMKPAKPDPRLRELVDEIVRLSTQFGVLTEYTAFFAREGVDLGRKDELVAETGKNLTERALPVRSGYAALNQEMNRSAQKQQAQVNPSNAYLDATMNKVSVAGVQQAADTAFWKRGDRWVDSRLLGKEATARRVVEVGSDEYFRLATRLASEGRTAGLALRGEVLLYVGSEAVTLRPASSESRMDRMERMNQMEMAK